MSAIRETIDISASPEDVYAYVTDPRHLPEWQESAVSARPLDGAPPHVGQRVAVTRRMGKREFPMTMEVKQLDPPRSWHMEGVDGPVRGHVHGAIEPLDGGKRSRLTLDLEVEGHGIGRVIAPLVVKPHVRKEMARNEERLRNLLEH
ncbi:SRPBCC family protein [Streptomyces sp. BR123]|uniref:SRPBCC family protein n=1 Tax=Streptomyces sp. BR123 TaxID=2749828 RepID=UPI0015C4E621|nr:SRPBCC family protein [Streptomyces sp. BR123]NXY98339.1 SRPBCC family protein [Streptomyces sp. BR123]